MAIAKCNLFALASSRLSCPCTHCKHQYVQTHTYTCIGEWLAAYNQGYWMQELGPPKGSFEVSQSFNHTLPATSLWRLLGNEEGLIKTGALEPSHIYIFMKCCKLFTAPPPLMQSLRQTVFFSNKTSTAAVVTLQLS